ncbi:ATP-binding cassette domain-containing protein [Cohnella rhizosphaerae]|uniref:ATP-binding cassette domain-containing protein n=1 Tax=Cohnella rhizosphaerae TaxID=1457232 RepID=A0A9X4KXA3_9BACL|nr:ATP-binding cassette domain-containing protein [Cohnella rhizosphaerae]MDG0812243.1 ATP-binding cassette domain-containing protein [Cohnella rhizosphaerae]
MSALFSRPTPLCPCYPPTRTSNCRCEWPKKPRGEWKSRVTACLELVGLGKRMHHRPFEMSGGEQQRVAIAKAIAHRPSLLLADEPTAELDSQMAAQVMAVFREIVRTENVTICMTTHDTTIMEVADHVYEMVDGVFVAG